MKMKENKTLQWLPLFLLLASFFLLTSSDETRADTSDSVADGIRIDCGAGENYTDNKTNFSYKADNFFEYGKAYNVSWNYAKEQVENQLKTLRSFPEGKRNCYTVPIRPSNNGNTYYLVRTFFAYGNYDNKEKFPLSFDLYIGVNYWATFNRSISRDVECFEVIHLSSTDEINVCLVDKGHGTPFVSLLEVFPWKNSRYHLTASSFLRLVSRSQLGLSKDDATYIRYANDIYARSWLNNMEMENSERINTSSDIELVCDTCENTFKLPKEVLSSAVQSVNANSSLVINMDPYTAHGCDHYVYLHFYDFVNESQNQQRKMVISFSDGVDVSFVLDPLKPTTLVRNIKGDYINNISIRSTSDSLPAMLNAYEIYRVLPQQQVNSTTDEGDVVAIQDIKRAYNIKKISWQGDPCGPMDCRWEGLICKNYGIPRITSIDLSNSNLNGTIQDSFSNFPELKVLNLSNNSLIGKIPDSLAAPPKLSFINLTRNKIKGPIPPGLVQKMKAGKLKMSVDEENDRMSTAEKVGAIVGGTAGGSAVISALAYTLKVRLRLRLGFGKKNDKGRRSGKKKEDNESKDKTTVGVRDKATRDTGESGSESPIDKASDDIQEQIPGL